MTTNLLGHLVDEVARFVQPLTSGLENPQRLRRTLDAIGVPENSATDITAALNALAAFETRLEALASQDDVSFATLEQALDAARDAFASLSTVADPGTPDPALPTLGRNLLDLLVAAWLANRHPILRDLGVLLTLVESAGDQPLTDIRVDGAQPIRLPFRLDRLHLDRLVALLRDPVSVLRSEYLTPLATDDDAAALADKLFPRIESLLSKLNVSCRYGIHPDDAERLGNSAEALAHSLIVYSDDLLRGASAEAGVVLSISAASGGDLGLVIQPFGNLSVQGLIGSWLIQMQASANVSAIAWGRHGVTFPESASPTEFAVDLSAAIDAPSDGPAVVLGVADGTRLEIGGVELAAAASLAEARQLLTLSADVSRAALIIKAADADSFLAGILPEDGLRAEFDLGIGWSSDTGLHLRGSAGLEADLPIGFSIAGVSVPSVHLGLRVADERITAEISATLNAAIGPVYATLDRVGIEGTVSFPENGGNLGAADLSLGFKGPAGVGLAVDAKGIVSGGGFLFHDAALGIYAGAMQLSIRNALTVKAFGLIATRMPDGSRGYSLIIFITVEDFRPLQLGFGFTLLGIGGMVAINRTFDQNALRAGLANDTLGTLLFPRDPVGNAATLISALAGTFPAERGAYLLGLLAKIGWFTPTLVTIDLALMVEFGVRTRLLALARISALLPSADNDLVRLTMNSMGVFDFDAQTAAIDAVLVDSRLVHRFPITGSAALRAGFGSGADSTFVLSIGGLNPRFERPAALPELRRVAIALSSGDNPRLNCEAYFAITANTLQFGAHASLYAGAGGFSIEGDIGFDVLIGWAPFHFVADFHARVRLARGSTTLFMLEVAGQLEGPRPLHLSATVRFKIWFLHFTTRFDATLIDGDPPPSPPAVDVGVELANALLLPQSWSTQPAGGAAHGVAMRSLPGGAGAPLVLDPLGQVAVRQQVVPLNTAREIDTFGSAPVTGERRFSLTALLAGTPLASAALQSQFAPSQYFVMSDDEKLTAPSFDTMDAGCVFGSAATVIHESNIIKASLDDYATIIIGADTGAPPQQAVAASRALTAPGVASSAAAAPTAYTLSAQQLRGFSRGGAVARASVRRAGRARFRNDSIAAAATFKSRRWKIVSRVDGREANVAPEVRSWSDYHAALRTLNRARATWQLVPANELEG